MPDGLDVVVKTVEARPTAVVRAATTWAEFPRVWKGMLDQVWDELHAAGITEGCRNVMLYLDDVPHVEIGVLYSDPAPLGDPVVRSELPGGTVAMAVHRGPFTGIGAAHEAVRGWVAEHDARLAGPSWEVYGPHNDDPALIWTEVYYQLAD